MTNNSKNILFAFLLGGVSFGSIIYTYFHYQREIKPVEIEKRLGEYKFINPLLDCSVTLKSKPIEIYPFTYFKEKIEAYIANQSKEQISTVSVYFRDLNNGPVFGINEDNPIRLGSLLKVPLAIGYYKKSELLPNLLNENIKFNDAEKLKLYDVQGVKPSVYLQIGKNYTIDELISAALKRSDNVAASLLESYDLHSGLIKTSQEMDIPIRAGVPPDRSISVQEYAGFFRILFNASYLNKMNSNKLLSYLSESDFKDGLVKGVGDNSVKISHKFGEAFENSTPKTFYFSDCGIIYFPKRPYLLCVAVKGYNFDSMKTVIQDISKITYSEMKESFP